MGAGSKTNLTPLFALGALVMTSEAAFRLTLAAFVVWFFLFAGASPVPVGIQI